MGKIFIEGERGAVEVPMPTQELAEQAVRYLRTHGPVRLRIPLTALDELARRISELI